MGSEDNPYRPGASPPRRPPKDHDPSVEHEPQFAFHHFEADDSEQTAGHEGDPIGPPTSEEDRVDQSVWDEPALSPTLAGARPADAPTYASWLTHGEQSTSLAKSWWICFGVALAAGPMAIVGTLIHQLAMGRQAGAIAICVVGPAVEEMMKIALVLWIVEKRPFYFKSTGQIVFCAAASGVWFAVIENLLYLNVYIPDPTPGIIIWRWTACVLLHVGCAMISSIGISRLWHTTITTRTRPQLSLAARLIATAMVIHGIYNAAALVTGVLGKF
ncbi:MAG: PrsW family glutamic-type intramembrane protease [Planctomycetota bacterium]